MKNVLFVAFSFSLLALVSVAVLDCGGNSNSGLSVSVNPTEPIVIDEGSTITLANGETVTPPYFAVNNLTVTWTSTSTSAQILALKFVATDGSNNQCAFSGTDISTLFSSVTYVDSTNTTQTTSLVNANGNVSIPAVVNNYVITYTTAGGLIYCSGLTLTNQSNSSIYSSYNVPMDVALYGQTVQPSGEATGRLTAVSFITLQ